MTHCHRRHQLTCLTGNVRWHRCTGICASSSRWPPEVGNCVKIACHGKICMDSQISQNCAAQFHNFLVGLAILSWNLNVVTDTEGAIQFIMQSNYHSQGCGNWSHSLAILPFPCPCFIRRAALRHCIAVLAIGSAEPRPTRLMAD